MQKEINQAYEPLAKKAQAIFKAHSNATKKELAFYLNKSLLKPYSNDWTAIYNAEKGGFVFPESNKGKAGRKARRF